MNTTSVDRSLSCDRTAQTAHDRLGECIAESHSSWRLIDGLAGEAVDCLRSGGVLNRKDDSGQSWPTTAAKSRFDLGLVVPGMANVICRLQYRSDVLDRR